jgi:hypothetical protein
MSENQKRILQMLSDGKINVDDAQRLLSLLGNGVEKTAESIDSTSRGKFIPRYMRVVIEPKQGTGGDEKHEYKRVNVRVPFNLIRAGMKLATLIPADAADRVDAAFKEKGISFDIRKMKDEDMEELIRALHDSEVNIDSGHETVRVYAE